MTLTPRSATDDKISAPTWRPLLFAAAISVYPFELDDSYPISAGLHCARPASGNAATAPISDELGRRN
jgi:hypothetical protein